MKKKQWKIIKDLIAKADEIYSAGDPDREGELLIRELLEKAKMKKGVKLYRIWALNTTPEALKKEIKAKRPLEDYDSLYKSALARQHGDWLYGMNMTQGITLHIQKKLGWDKSKELGTFSVGRVQTAVLEILKKREEEIKNFKPEKYFIINGEFEKKDKFQGKYIEIEKGKEIEQIKDEKKAKKIYEEAKKAKQAIIKDVVKERKSKKFHLKGAYSKTELIADLKSAGISVDKGLKLLQSLYERGIISYPRTDNNYLNVEDWEIFLKNFSKLKSINTDLKKIIEEGEKKGYFKKPKKSVVDPSKVASHTGLYVVSLTGTLSADEKKVIDYISRRIIAHYFPEYVYDETKVYLDVNNHTFRAIGQVTIEPGWKKVYKAKTEDVILPELKKGDKVKVNKIKLEKKETKPPSPYTESSLLKLLENLAPLVKEEKNVAEKIRKLSKERKIGLGTAATREQILETLINRGYVEKKGKKGVLELTDKARILLENFSTSPLLTAMWEIGLDKIVNKEITYDTYMKKLKENIEKLIKKYV